MKKVSAIRSTEIFIDCPYCNADITHIPDKEIKDISPENPEKVKCPRCSKLFLVKKIN